MISLFFSRHFLLYNVMEMLIHSLQDEYSIFPQSHSMDIHGYVLVYSVTSMKRSVEDFIVTFMSIMNLTLNHLQMIIFKKDFFFFRLYSNYNQKGVHVQTVDCILVYSIIFQIIVFHVVQLLLFICKCPKNQQIYLPNQGRLLAV